MRLRVPALFLGPLLTASAIAAAEPPEVDRLLAALQVDEITLATEECAGACRALSSMQRSADRICALEPGARCDEARARVKAARAKVLSRCPVCASPAPGTDTTTLRPEPPPPVAKAAHAADREAAPTSQGVPEERRRGGCAGCSSAGAGAPGGALMTLLATALGASLARRRARRPERRG